MDIKQTSRWYNFENCKLRKVVSRGENVQGMGET